MTRIPYIRSKDDALDAVAGFVDLADRREQIIQCTVHIMQCLDPEARAFMYDCQVLLIEGGLDALRRKRRDLIEHLEETGIVAVIDPEEDKIFEEVASAFDALRLSDVVRQVFRDLADRYAPWEIARALLGREQEVQERIVGALRVRKTEDPGPFDDAQRSVETLILDQRPAWHAQATRIRKACRDVLAHESMVGPNDLESEADLLSSLIAAAGNHAESFLEHIDREPQVAIETVAQFHHLADTVRKLMKEGAEGQS